MRFPDVKKITDCIQKTKNIDEVLEACGLQIGVPCRPMLAKPCKGFRDVLDKLQDKTFVCEFKYDGLRGQIHHDHQATLIFSRNLENQTSMYPDIIQLVRQLGEKSGKNFILDSEIVAVGNQGEILPFQTLATRSKKNVTLDNQKI